MFQKLHRQMTIFCTLVTGTILVALSLVCLIFAQNSITENNYASFLKETGTILANLQSMDYISHQWLGQMQEERHVSIYLYDNGMPLYYDRIRENSWDLTGIDIFQDFSDQMTFHEEFPLEIPGQGNFYVSTGFLTRENGRLGFVILYHLSHQNSRLLALRLAIAGADLAALALLALFSHFFTGRMLRPMEESRKKQEQFIASASHELRSPLAVMLSGLESMEKANSKEERSHFAAMIRREGHHMRHLISDLLLLANSGAGALTLCPSQVQPDELLLEIYEKYERLAANSGISLFLQLPEALKETFPENCLWDRERVAQILSIFVDNALSYTPFGGKIILFLAYVHREAPSLPLPVHRKKPSILLGVADTGPGICDTEKELVFERFYRSQHSRTEREHFGLGLSAAKTIATAHKGKIWVEDAATCRYLTETQRPLQGGAVFLVEFSDTINK